MLATPLDMTAFKTFAATLFKPPMNIPIMLKCVFDVRIIFQQHSEACTIS